MQPTGDWIGPCPLARVRGELKRCKPQLAPVGPEQFKTDPKSFRAFTMKCQCCCCCLLQHPSIVWSLCRSLWTCTTAYGWPDRLVYSHLCYLGEGYFILAARPQHAIRMSTVLVKFRALYKVHEGISEDIDLGVSSNCTVIGEIDSLGYRPRSYLKCHPSSKPFARWGPKVVAYRGKVSVPR